MALPWSGGVISPDVLPLCHCSPLGLTESVAPPERHFLMDSFEATPHTHTLKAPQILRFSP